jgi:glycosyltransferase involved in cell wall biosynthesis
MTAETSFSVPPADPPALAAAVASMLAHEDARQARGAAARQLALDRYAWPDIARRLVEIYDEARGVAPAVAA